MCAVSILITPLTCTTGIVQGAGGQPDLRHPRRHQEPPERGDGDPGAQGTGSGGSVGGGFGGEACVLCARVLVALCVVNRMIRLPSLTSQMMHYTGRTGEAPAPSFAAPSAPLLRSARGAAGEGRRPRLPSLPAACTAGAHIRGSGASRFVAGLMH